MRASKLRSTDFDQVWLPVVEMFLEGLPVAEIAKAIQREHGVDLSREAVYPIVRDAARRNFLHVTPPRDVVLAREFERFPNRGRVEVVRVRGPSVNQHLTAAGAQVAFELIHDLGRSRDRAPVHIGLGIGRTTLEFARQLAVLMRADPLAPPLVVHALATAYSWWDPLETPLAAFSFFTEAQCDVKFVGLAAEPIAPAGDYDEVIRHEIVRDAFDKAAEIDVVVTSMASAEDEHGYLYNYAKRLGDGAGLERLAAEGWKGDVHLRPYSDQGPLSIKRGGKPITLFELPKLVELVHVRGKHVILLCGPCGLCQKTKPDALLPLLLQPSLHLWSHLVVDMATAEESVAAAQGGAVKGGTRAREP
jgi:hypothetical protein